MKKILSVLAVALLLFSVPVCASAEETDVPATPIGPEDYKSKTLSGANGHTISLSGGYVTIEVTFFGSADLDSSNQITSYSLSHSTSQSSGYNYSATSTWLTGLSYTNMGSYISASYTVHARVNGTDVYTSGSCNIH